jgi:hypothetical protein
MFRLASLVVGRMILTTRLLKIIVVQHHFKRHFDDINIICMYGSYYYGNIGLDLGQAQQCSRVTPVNGTPMLPS